MSAGELLPQVILNPVVVEERVVDVEQKDGVGRGAHGDVPSAAQAAIQRAPRVVMPGRLISNAAARYAGRSGARACDPSRPIDPAR